MSTRASKPGRAPALPPAIGPGLPRFDRDVGLVIAAFAVLIAVENIAIAIGYKSEFASSWEMRSARLYLSPVALALSIPIAISLVLVVRLARGRRYWAVGFLTFLAGWGVAIGITGGRRMASLALRVPFVMFAAAAAGLIGWFLAKRLRKLRPSTLASLGAGAAIACLCADALVLPRLYPVFHIALFFIGWMTWGATALLLVESRWRNVVAFGGIVLATVAVAWSPYASRRVSTEDNLRRIVVEHAPLLGRAAILANRISPPPPLDDDDTATASVLSGGREAKPAQLDWTGHDIVVVTIDALRADHLSSYGYRRNTTPNIDALAARGARFDHAYCPTPHTSYSIASMMTGKYMKPLLALGNEDTSETWPMHLRRYGYRTAAFYPPAVFFIDEHRFRRLKDEHLGFEYAKEEFAAPDLRRTQVQRYVEAAPKDKPLLLWVHLFEPHEPYEAHPEHPFDGDPRVDAYDSEIALADALVGDIVNAVTAHRQPGTVFIVTADHGEEHGDHGGRYHGTTVYEEQVRVPLVVVGPGVPPHVVTPPVQTIDLLPTTLAALDVPIPPRLRGRNLAGALAGTAAPSEEGLAFAETDDYTLVARGADRLVCARKLASCTLFDVSRDPAEKQAIVDRPARVTELRKLTAAIERETGRIEATDLPDALRRGLQGDREAAEDVATLLDDSRLDIRRLAARCEFRLRAPEIAPQLVRAEKADDDEVRRWSALALLRLGGEYATAQRVETVDAILRKPQNPDQKHAAALVLAERGDARGEADLLAQWSSTFAPDARAHGELDDARELLTAFGKLRSKDAVPLLVRSLDDVRLRPHVVAALAEIGDPRAKPPLLRVFAEERYVHLRALEAKTLLELGAREMLAAPLARFAGTPEPLAAAILVARDAKLLTAERSGWVPDGKRAAEESREREVAVDLRVAKPGDQRLLVLAARKGAAGVVGSVGGVTVSAAEPLADSDVYAIELGNVTGRRVDVKLTNPDGIAALWLVPRAEEIPPPPKAAWKGGESSSDDPPPP